ncbi:hypothetical protein H0E84_12240 [Luteimonas sp. SJ-92]|uniref:Uncharacterized protein n=1 Tax=Luteimonas salinisoli TaxID=2752307 RepID=A0A853JF25_9GAMM|nr:hypothetical protein [Luteimonas salinisoli]NZA27150.1 hypothetical protein [Luteimonas salinisoli]
MKSTTAMNAASLRSPHAVTVSVPASVANDLGKMNEVTKSILGRLGCEGCHSGFDIRYLIERDFRVNPDLRIEGFSPHVGF